MSLTSKIKSILAINEKSMSDLARYRSITRQSVQSKASKNSWNVADLLAVAELTKTKLAFIDSKNDMTFILSNENEHK